MSKENGLAGEQVKTTRKPLPSADVIAALPKDGGKEFNRLIFEQSPYLLQHARNPVDWYPWGSAAFKKAKAENKPVFLSVGYSTCHWCHVMEHESFEDDEVAALMNKYFVCIKVDREERPDIDNIYMAVTQAMTGSGGWPMTVVMTPDKKPFFAGTYFPKSGMRGRPGMMQLIPQIANAWEKDNKKILESSEQIIAYLKKQQKTGAKVALEEDSLKQAFLELESRFDSELGGFGRDEGRPKFPTPHHFNMLIRYADRYGNRKALSMVEVTLQAMRKGGIYDHIGYGFHRYSTDRQWLLPHFEKMLYDQAMLILAYTSAGQLTGKEEYKRVTDEVITYVLRDMTSEKGGFYSAEDADSEGIEGLFYVWKMDEIKKLLAEKDAALVLDLFNFEKDGNFYEQTTRRKTGENIPHLRQTMSEYADTHKLNLDDLTTRVEGIRKTLFNVREKRIHPFKDDKVLTDWNGLMIASLARAGVVFKNPNYIKAARKAMDFVLSDLRDKDGRLMKRWRRGKAGLPAHIEDYAFVIWGLLNLYEADFDIKYLQAAVVLNKDMITHFWDKENGGFFLTADDNEKLFIRSKEVYDGAIPSGNSVAALNLLRLSRMTGDMSLEKKGDDILAVFTSQVKRSPSAFSQLMQALDFATSPSYEIVVVAADKASANKAMLPLIETHYSPNKVVLLKTNKNAEELAKLAPYTKNMVMIDGKPTVYICQNYTCKRPTTDASEITKALH
ncbi:thioredoxin domain-containing protein [bacterium AH-315-E10]|nr:thioredoxin domain-containing protein [bacterium AH-315-E10]